MYIIDILVKDLSQFLDIPEDGNNPLRIHSKKLKTLGDVSFPLRVLHPYISTSNETTNTNESNCDLYVKKLQENSKEWDIQLSKVDSNLDNINLHLERSSAFRRTIEQCLLMKDNYGALKRTSKLKPTIKINGSCECCEYNGDFSDVDLTKLRLMILQKVTENLINFCSNENEIESEIIMNLTSTKHKTNDILCGVIVNENGTKNNITAQTLYKKRSTDMRLMAEHKYGLRKRSSESWNEYFETLGKSAVTIELIQNKPHKSLKISLNDSSSSNKGPAFILYNCARLSALLGEFDRRVENKVYEELIPLRNVDFSLLQEPEEWEILYVYIMQYPLLIKTCIGDVEKGLINPHHLASFLYNLCAIFSVYYRRIRILISPRAHLIPTLNARIYLLKALQQVFLKTLRLLNIEPIKEM